MGPPAIPKGTPHPLTFAVKPAVIPSGKVWALGKLRDRASKAARHQRKVDERKAIKALRRATLGQQIYAYVHFRTNQVVYSLSRFLEEGKILPQLLDHGKKTRPPSLRKDHWSPYFKVQFPTSRHGLTAYQQLRELSVLRQTAPTDALVSSSESSHFRFHPDAEYDPNSKAEKARLGSILPKKQRARILMDQKATSVADVAFVLGMQHEIDPTKVKLLRVPPDNHVKFPKRALRNMRKRRDVFERLSHQEEVQLQAVQQPRVPFSDSAKARIAFERNGIINSEGGVTLNGESATASPASDQIRVLWADLRDATYAASWPTTVIHGELEPKAEVHSEEDGPVAWSSRYVHGNARDRAAEHEIAKQRREEANIAAAEQAAAAMDRKRSSPRLQKQTLPAMEDISGAGLAGPVVPPPKPLSSRLTDALMFWRR